jgi:competence protein ComEC
MMLITTTLCAQFAVSPVLLMLDPRVPVFSLAANLIVLPVQPLVMALGGLSVLSGFFLPPLGALFGRLVWPMIVLSNRVALLTSFNPRGVLRLPDSSAIAAGILVSAALVFASIRQLQALSKPSAND